VAGLAVDCARRPFGFGFIAGPWRSMNSRRSNLFPTVVACIIFLAVKIGLDSAGTVVGIPSYIDYGYTVVIDHGLYDEEKDGSSTDFGFYGLLAGVMLAWRAFHIAKTHSIRGGLDLNQRRAWAAWLIGSSVYIVLSVAIDFTPIGGAFRWYVKLALAAAVFWLGRRIFEYFKSKAC
jgi:hypothetical protein